MTRTEEGGSVFGWLLYVVVEGLDASGETLFFQTLFNYYLRVLLSYTIKQLYDSELIT